MKNRLLKIAFATIVLFQSASYMIAQDYSGHHSDSDGGKIIDMIPIPVAIIIVVIGAIALWDSRDKN